MNTKRSRSTATALTLFCVLAALSTVAAAQSSFIPSNAQNAVDYRERSSAHVDPATGALQFQITLGAYKGRAGLDLPVTLYYSSKVWEIRHQGTIMRGSECAGCSGEPDSTYGGRFALYSAAGWTSNLDWFKWEEPPSFETYDEHGRPCVSGCTSRVARLFLRLPDGARHEFRRDDTIHPFSAGALGGTYHSVDGSRMRYDASSGTLYLPDGSQYLSEWTAASVHLRHYVDRHGNRLTYDDSAKQWTDTLGRTYGLPPLDASAPADRTYSLPGVGGSSQQVTFVWKRLEDVRTDPSEPLHYVGDRTTTYPHIPVSPNLFLFSSPGSNDSVVDGNNGERFNPVLLHKIVLADQSAYTFTYNRYGEIDKVVYPTGGYEKFTYGQVPPLSAHVFDLSPAPQANRGVLKRWVSAKGDGSDETPWDYNPGAWSVVTAPDLTRTETYRHGGSGSLVLYGFDDPRAGRAYEERVVTAAGQVLRRRLTEWAVDGATEHRGPYVIHKQRNPRVAKEVLVVLDAAGGALSATTKYEYDADLNVKKVERYGYRKVTETNPQTGGIGGFLAGQLLRVEETDYLTDDQAYRDRNMLSLPKATRVRDGALALLAQTEIRYDEEAYAPLPCGAAVGWVDPGQVVRGLPTTTRGWLNTTGGWVETHAQYDACGSPRKSWDAHLEDAGVHGRVSEVEYSPAYKYAYPTKATSAVPDPTGQYGSASAFTTSTAYDFWTGRVTSTTDANQVVTNFAYEDPLGRLTRTLHAVGTPDQAQTTVAYDDVNRTVTTTSDLTLYEDNRLKTVAVYDGLGRAVETRRYESETAYVSASVRYDVMGRAYLASQPSRGLGEATDGWVRTSFDALGRVTEVATFAGAAEPPPAPETNGSWTGSVTTSYVGNVVTVTDQAGRKRRSITDALGRLVRVDEPDAGNGLLDDASGNPVQPTFYAYDALGNLRMVEQSGQLVGQQVTQRRFFAYDSLGRLVRAKNPEQGDMTADADFPALTDLSSGVSNGQWSMGYRYDAAGNLVKRKDARGVVTTYGYDGLNRNTTVHYDDAALGAANHTPDAERHYDGAPNGKGRLWWHYSAGVAATGVDSYDAAGRLTQYHQAYWVGSSLGQYFNVSAAYDLAGNVKKLTYPSGHSVSYTYDAAGRLGGVTGNLGGGAARTYADSFAYDASGRRKQERYGTQTPVYNKHLYNSRGQLAEIRVSTYGQSAPGQGTNWNRGAIINHYSALNGAWGATGGGSDNNGNLLQQDVFIPKFDGAGYDLGGNFDLFTQKYRYDWLNRLTRAEEENRWAQVYDYDRWGNRTINAQETQVFGQNPTYAIPEPQFAVDAAANRLGVPSGQPGQMGYDAAGNLTLDTYQGGQGGGGTRAYDAENRMTSAQFLSGQTQTADYAYDADGRRVKRMVGTSSEVWQIYGPGGELLAEYAPNASPTSPLKEYGYRSGELLVTAAPGATAGGGQQQRVNYALAANGGVASASSSLNSPPWVFTPAGANDGDRKGVNWGSGGGWNDATSGTFPDWLQVEFDGPKSIDEVDVFTNQDNYASPAEPTEAMTFTQYGLTSYEVQYWTGSGWATVPGGSVSGNDRVWRRLTFPAVVTTKVRVLASACKDGYYSRLAEVEAWGAPVTRTNVALAANGGVASASSSLNSPPWVFTPAGANDGDRRGLNWGSGGGWNDATSGTFPDWLQIDFAGAMTIDEVNVFTNQDDYANPSEPTEGMTFTQYGLSSFEVQYWTGSGWATVPGGSVSGNDKVWRRFTFPAIPTTKIRVWTHACKDGYYSRLAEVEAWGAGAAGTPSGVDLRWLVTDQLGTPRMVVDKTGSLAGVKRHDYFPFGEEVGADVGGRTTNQGYVGDNNRFKFVGYERDGETRLDYAGARYYGSTMGRFTSVDPLMSSGTLYDPQTWNRYSYAINNPLKWTDPEGLYIWSASLGGNVTDEELRRNAGNDRNALRDANRIIERRNEFRNALAAAGRARDALPAGAERDLVSESLASYGAEGTANGVSVGQGRLADGVAAEARTAYFHFENGTFTAQVEVVLSDRRNGNLAVDVAHEGRHVADAQVFAAALTTDVAANGAESRVAIMGATNLTRYEREVRGYTVSSLVAQGLGLDNLSVGRREIWNRGWTEADRATRRSTAIDNHLRESPTYGLTPQNPGRRFIPR